MPMARSRSFLGALLVVLAAFAQAAGAGVSLKTSELEYSLGETVFFTLTNNLDETIYMPGSPYFLVLDAESEHLAPCTSLPTIVPLSPGNSDTGSWSQINCHTGSPVDEGLYWGAVEYWTESEPDRREVRAPFCIGPCDLPVSADDRIVTEGGGRVKAHYFPLEGHR
jgi:hypothetical protein